MLFKKDCPWTEIWKHCCQEPVGGREDGPERGRQGHTAGTRRELPTLRWPTVGLEVPSGLLCPEEREAVFHSYKRTDLFFQKVTSEVGRMDRMGPTYCLQASYHFLKPWFSHLSLKTMTLMSWGCSAHCPRETYYDSFWRVGMWH